MAMRFDSDVSSDDDGAARAQSRGTMKSIFASDRSAATAGGGSLKYEGNKKDRIAAEAVGASAKVEPGSAAHPGAGQTSSAVSAAVVAYRGDQQVGHAIVVVAVAQAHSHVFIVDRERRQLAKVPVDEALQVLPSEDPLYATVYDPVAQIHWTLLFKSHAECLGFVAAALTVQHYLLLPEGPRSPAIDLIEGYKDEFDRPAPAKNGDVVLLSQMVWRVKRIGPTYTIDKLIEEIVLDAPRRIELGENILMKGVEDAIVGLRKGSVRMVIVPPKRTKTSGLGNPELGPKDTVVVIFRLHDVDVDGETETYPQATGQSPPPAQPLAIEPRKEAAAAAAPPVAAAAPILSPARSDEDNLLKALLLQTVQMQQAQFQAMQNAHHPPPPPPAPAPAPPTEAPIPAHVERSLDRINQQLSSLYEKIDRLDFDKRLESNNEKIERMVKKAVGKMPVSDVDIEDMAKDKDQLLARIESLKQKLDEQTETYHQALYELGNRKDQHAAALNDLAIERSTNEKAMQDLKERHRLQLVEAEVRLRKAVDDAREAAFEEGREEGHRDGFQAGKIEAMSGDGQSDSVEQLRNMLSAKEQEIVNLQKRNGELERRLYEDRRLALEEKTALQSLVERLETKERQRQGVVYDQATAVAKTIRRVMNATYANFEAQLYATESTTVPVQDALNMALVAVKSEARLATDELKREAAARATEPPTASSGAGGASIGDEDGVGAFSPSSSAAGRGRGVSDAVYDSGAEGSASSPPNGHQGLQPGSESTATAAASKAEPVADEYLTRIGVRPRGGYDDTDSADAAGPADADDRTEKATADEIYAEATKNRVTTYAGALAQAYNMPTDGDETAAEYADEDEITAYLRGRGPGDDAEGEA